MEESQRCNPLLKLCIAMRREPNFRPPQKIPNYKAKLDGCTYSNNIIFHTPYYTNILAKKIKTNQEKYIKKCFISRK